MRTIAAQPLGTVLLILVAIGLGGYSIWRLVRALLGHGPEGPDSGMECVAALASGVVYAGLCAITIGLSGVSRSQPRLPQESKTEEMGARTRRWIAVLGTVGSALAHRFSRPPRGNGASPRPCAAGAGR